MALDVQSALISSVEREIHSRFEARGSDRKLSKTEQKKLRTIAQSACELAPQVTYSLLFTFLDHIMPIGGRFRPLRAIYFEWQTFIAEIWPQVQHLFPITAEDEEVLLGFFADWKALRSDRSYLNSIYRQPGKIGGASIARAFRRGPDFLRMLEVLRRGQAEQAIYPLFTLRGFLAAQVEALSGFVGELKIGHLVTEKAWGRYREWYLFRYYDLELALKGLKRPSATNPVSNEKIRLEHETSRAARGVRLAEHVFEGERAVAWLNRPALYWSVRASTVPLDATLVASDAKIELPPGMIL